MKNMNNRKIGVFDSGLGGLTVVREMERFLPAENVIYFGDTARVPYGNKSKSKIIEFSHQIMRFLLRHDIKAVIIACGTASSNALEELQESYDLPIIGVAEPGASAAIRATRNGRIGVLGTAATIRSGAFERLIRKENQDLEVFSQACPLFVPLFLESKKRDGLRKFLIENRIYCPIHWGVSEYHELKDFFHAQMPNIKSHSTLKEQHPLILSFIHRMWGTNEK